jgi:hypothetical protein
MKKNMGLFLGIVAIVLAALIFSGCPTEASAEKVVTTTKGAAADLEGLKALLEYEGVYAVDYHGILAIGSTQSLTIPIGKTVNVQGGGVTIDAGGSLVVDGTLNLPSGSLITAVTGGYVTGSNVASNLVVGTTPLTIADDIDAVDFSVEKAVAVRAADSAAITAEKVPDGSTLLVLGDLAIDDTAPEPAGTVKALGNVVLNSATVDIANPKLNFEAATLKSAANVVVTATTTAGATTAVGAIDAAGGFTLSEGTLTVNGAANFAGAATFDGVVDFKGDVNFGGGAVASLNADSSLAEGKTIIVADQAELDVNAAIKVDGTIKVESGGTIVEGSGTSPSINKNVAVAGGPLFAFGASSGGFVFGQFGKVELENGSIYSGGGQTFIGTGAALYAWDPTRTDGKVTLPSNTRTELTGGNILVAQNAAIANGTTIAIAAGASLTVPSTAALTVNGTLEVTGNLIAANPSSVTVGDGGEIVRPETITWTAVADGGSSTATSTKITFTFSKEVWGLTTDNINVSQGSISVVPGALTGSGTKWDLLITVGEEPGSVQVSVSSEKNKPIESGSKPVTVHVQGEETPTDTTPPGDVTLHGVEDADISDTSITLSWDDPTDGDLDHIEISWNGQQGDPLTVSKGTETATATGLTYNTSYTFTVKAVDGTGNRSGGKEVTKTTKPRPSSKLTVTFSGLPTDEAKDITGDKDKLSWSAKDTLTVEVDAAFTGCRWYLETESLTETENSLTLEAAKLDVKPYYLTVFVTAADGFEYAKRLTFTVTE